VIAREGLQTLVRRDYAAGRYRRGPSLVLLAIVAVVSMALAGPALAAGPPTVTKLIPREANSAGGTSVTIIGTDFTGATAVKFGSTNAASFTVNSNTMITAVSPPESFPSTVVDVTVTTPEGTSPTSRPADEFHYLTLCQEGHAPAITSIEPHSGPAGTSVRIKGERFFTVVCTSEGFSVERVLFGFTEATSFKSPKEGEIVAVAPPGTGNVDVTVESWLGQSPVTPADRFSYTPGAPTVETKAASSVAQTSATLNATVNPNGNEVSECKLEYGTSTAYGSSAPCTPAPGSGTSAVAVSASVTGLVANTSYHFRVSATNANGTSMGLDQTFTTLPKAPTILPCTVQASQTSARLCASVNPNGGEVSECKFEYGTTTSYGSSAPCTPAPGSGTSPVEVSAEVTGLTPSTTYHFRVAATNPDGTSTGSDQTFTTLSPSAPTVVTEAASAVAQTSATLHATVNPDGFEVSACRFEYGTMTSYGSSGPCTPAPGSGTSAVAVSAALESLGESTTYHFRIVATNANGTSFGADQTFTTRLVLGPHWYKNGVILEGGAVATDMLAWGVLTLENSKIGALTCQTLGGGDIANPAGGGGGKGALDGFTVYDCVAPTCEAAGGKLEVLPEKLEWSSLLIEEAAVFRDKLEGIGLRVICAASALNLEFHGTLKPTCKAGTLIGSAPSRLEFEAGSGSLESTQGPGAVTGNLKVMGFESAEIIRAKNP
jgi:hypothetical protein